MKPASDRTNNASTSSASSLVYPPLPMVLDVIKALQADGKKSFKVYPLESLNLSNNRIESLPPCFSLQFPHLKTLKLAKNKVFCTSMGKTVDHAFVDKFYL